MICNRPMMRRTESGHPYLRRCGDREFFTRCDECTARIDKYYEDRIKKRLVAAGAKRVEIKELSDEL